MNTKRLFSNIVGAGMRLAILASMLMAALLSTATSALAATTAEIVPTADGTYSAWTGGYTAVDEGTAAPACTGNGEYISSNTANARESVEISLTSIPDGSTITGITVLAYDRRDGNNSTNGGTYATFVRLDGVDSGPSTTHAVNGNCTPRTDGFVVPDTVKTGTTTVEVGVIKLNTGGSTNNTVRVGVLSAVITYTTPTPTQPQTITFDTLADKTFGDADFTVSATSDSGLPVSFSASNDFCTITGDLVHLTGAGSCMITASQAGDSTYLPALDVQQSFNIAQASQTITFDPLADKTFGDADFTVSATASSGLAVSFSALGDCSVTGDLVHLTGVGSCTITASQAGDVNYLAAADVEQTFAITEFTGIHLYAVTGDTNLPGLAASVPVLGYSYGSSVNKPGGPVIHVNVGEQVEIMLTNNLNEPTALLIQGQPMIPDLVGIPGGGSKIYKFKADKPGTFLYEAGLLSNSQKQVAMGLYGALIVGGNPATDNVLVLSELDTALNNNPSTFDIRDYSPKYYLINGKAFPDTDTITAGMGDTVLLRYVNAGLQAHSMSTLGLSQTIIANDGNLLNNPYSLVAETIATGQTMDMEISIPDVDDVLYPVYDASLFLRNNNGSGPYAGLGGMLTMIQVGDFSSSNDTTPPTTSSPIGISPNPSDRSTPVVITATITDADSNIAAAEFYIDSLFSSPFAMSASDLAFDSSSEAVTGSIPTAMLDILITGNHDIFVRGKDAAGNWSNTVMGTLEIIDGTTGPNGSLHFSTSGQTNSGPNGVGADFGDIYSYDSLTDALGLAFDDLHGLNVDGFSPVSSTEFYVSFADDVTVGDDDLAVAKEDVAHYVNGAWTVDFDGSTVGLESSNIDAISVDTSTDTLYFSTSDNTLPSGAGDPLVDVGDDADIYSWVMGETSVTREYDATHEGWSGNNVDGLLFISPTNFYLSYSPTSTPVAGLGIVQDEDVVHYMNGVWSIYFDGTAVGLTSYSLDVDAFNVP